MKDKPLLYLLGCYRDEATCTEIMADAKKGRRILSGPLRGCWNLPSGPCVRVGRGYCLVFKPVIRISL